MRGRISTDGSCGPNPSPESHPSTGLLNGDWFRRRRNADLVLQALALVRQLSHRGNRIGQSEIGAGM